VADYAAPARIASRAVAAGLAVTGIGLASVALRQWTRRGGRREN
jgi:hypothetical protein